MRVLNGFWLALFTPSVLACSFAQPKPVELDRRMAKPNETRPLEPEVTVASVYRGSADNPMGFCSDTGVITLTVPATPETRELAYSFKLVSGTADDLIFFRGSYQGFEDAQTGRIKFVFPWVDGASATQEPLNLVVRVTPYRLSGLKGKSTKVTIVDPGR